MDWKTEREWNRKKIMTNGLLAGRANSWLIAGCFHLMIAMMIAASPASVAAFTSCRGVFDSPLKSSVGEDLTVPKTKSSSTIIGTFSFSPQAGNRKPPDLLPIRLSAQDTTAATKRSLLSTTTSCNNFKVWCAATASNTSGDENAPLLSSPVAKFRSFAREVTGSSLTSMREAGRSTTGFSLTSLVRVSLRAAIGQPVTSVLRWFVSLFPFWVRYIYL